MGIFSKANRNTWLHIAILSVAVLIVYSKVLGAGFMFWDDIDYIFNTPDIKGYSVEHFANWWTGFFIGNYQPLPMMSYAFDYMLVGTEPFLYHLVNILWHIMGAAILYLVMKRLQGNAYIALIVALLFALHPIQTESVSWVAARNKVMNGFFFLSAMYLYVGYVRQQQSKKLWLIYILGVAAYCCKLTAVTLPFAFFAIDIWLHRPLNNKRVWLEKLPLVILAIPIGLINLQAQEEVSFLYARGDFNLLHSIVFAGYAYVQYIINLLLPTKLSVLYPYPTEIGIVELCYTFIAIVVVVVLGFVAYRKKWFVLAGGILFFTVNIAVVLQFVQFGEVLMADRYLYLACIGIWYPVVHYTWQFLTQKANNYKAAFIALSILCAVYSSATFARNDIWLSEYNFWQAIIDKFPESSVAQSSLGGVYMQQGDNKTALQYINKAIEVDKNNHKAWHNKAVVLLRMGDVQSALAAAKQSLILKEQPQALFTRALIYQQMGKPNETLADITKVLQLQPNNAKAHYINADCIEQQGSVPLAIQEYSRAIELDANEPLFYLRRGLANAKAGNSSAAIQDMSAAININTQYAEAWYWRGMIKYRSKQQPCADLQQAAQLNMIEAKQALQEICAGTTQ